MITGKSSARCGLWLLSLLVVFSLLCCGAALADSNGTTGALTWTLSGILGGIGGAFMSMGYLTSFTKDMVAGRGYIGLSASSMVGGSPIGAMFCALIFGVADAVSNQLQLTNAPADLVLMLPYIVTIVVLVVISVINYNRANRKAKA